MSNQSKKDITIPHTDWPTYCKEFEKAVVESRLWREKMLARVVVSTGEGKRCHRIRIKVETRSAKNALPLMVRSLAVSPEKIMDTYCDKCLEEFADSVVSDVVRRMELKVLDTILGQNINKEGGL